MFEDDGSENKNLSGSKDEKMKAAEPDRKFAADSGMVSVPVTGSVVDRAGPPGES